LPPKPSKFKRFRLPVGLLLLGLIIGGASGASAVPEPVEIEKRVEVPVEKIVTKKETPASCLKAIQHAEEIFGVAADMTGVMADGMKAAAYGTVADINAVTARIEALNTELDTHTGNYKPVRDACQASR
jgi:uncharacterized hydantoinase/oxoprolinase family protein